MLIKVKTLTGKEIELDIDPDDKISRVKEKVEEQSGVPPAQQRLIFGGRQIVALRLSGRASLRRRQEPTANSPISRTPKAPNPRCAIASKLRKGSPSPQTKEGTDRQHVLMRAQHQERLSWCRAHIKPRVRHLQQEGRRRGDDRGRRRKPRAKAKKQNTKTKNDDEGGKRGRREAGRKKKAEDNEGKENEGEDEKMKKKNQTRKRRRRKKSLSVL
ncbi:hypothetical protein NMY22_g16075 [Coprinellus aureogranulatus]|nr:hypothetical protein NMY22_g16075 [Coprinellus aureogranulatus]